MADSHPNKRPLVIALLLVLVTGVVFHDVLTAGFVRWDDGMHVYANPYLHPVSARSFARFWMAPYQNLYIPLSYSLYALLAILAHLPRPVPTVDGLWIDLNPRIFHAAGLCLHLVNVLLVFALLRRLLPGPLGTAARDWAAGVGALLFAVHPVQVESVAWIAEMRGLLAGTFSLLALHAYLSGCWESPPQPPIMGESERSYLSPLVPPLLGARGASPALFYALATLCFGLALLAKPSAVAVPLLALTLETLILRRPIRLWRGGLGIWGLLCIAFLWLTHTAQPVTVDIVTPLWTRPLIAGDALAFYAGKLLWPTHLGIDYGRSPVWLTAQTGFGWTSLMAFALGVVVWLCRRRLPWLAASCALFAAALLPTLGLTPFVFQVYSTVADRYLYLALLGPALGVAWALASQMAKPRVSLAAWSGAAAVLLLFALGSLTQTRCWQNSIALFSQALAVNPLSWVADNNLGAVALDRNDPADALPLLTDAIRLRPDYAEAHGNLGMALLATGNRSGAEAEFRAAIRLKPQGRSAYAGLGNALLSQGRAAEAAAAFRQAQRVN